MLRLTNRTRQQQSHTQPFILIRDGQQVVYDIHDARIVLRRRGGMWTKYLTGKLPSGVRFEAGYGRATGAEVRRWKQNNGIGPAQQAAASALHALVDRIAGAIGLDRALALFAQAISAAKAMA